jgi:hypothetical protein
METGLLSKASLSGVKFTHLASYTTAVRIVCGAFENTLKRLIQQTQVQHNLLPFQRQRFAWVSSH